MAESRFNGIRLVRFQGQRNLSESQISGLASRRGKKRATFAIAHTLLIMTYHIFKEQSTYKDLGSDFFDRLNENT